MDDAADGSARGLRRPGPSALIQLAPACVGQPPVASTIPVREALRAEPAGHDGLSRLSSVGDIAQLLLLAIGQAMLATTHVRLGCRHALGGSRKLCALAAARRIGHNRWPRGRTAPA